MLSGAISVITDERLTQWTAPALFEQPTVGQLAAAGAVAVGLYLAVRPGKNPFLLPGILLAAAVLAHVVFALTERASAKRSGLAGRSRLQPRLGSRRHGTLATSDNSHGASCRA